MGSFERKRLWRRVKRWILREGLGGMEEKRSPNLRVSFFSFLLIFGMDAVVLNTYCCFVFVVIILSLLLFLVEVYLLGISSYAGNWCGAEAA